MDETLKRGNIIGIVMVLIFLVCIFVVPPETIGLDMIGFRTLGVLGITLALLISETMPIVITCFLCICLMFLFGAVPTMNSALSGFTNTTSFFVLVSFALTKAVTKMPLSNRLLLLMIKLFGKNVDTLLLAFMVTTAILSAFMSNIATTAIFTAIVLDLLRIYKDENNRRLAGRSFMIGLVIASTLGGMLTPAGTSVNLLAIELLEQHTGIRVTFLQWMLYGVPITIVSLPFTWLLLTRAFKIPALEAPAIADFEEQLNESIPKKIAFKEKYVLVVIMIMFTLWVLSSWYPKLDITFVAAIGSILMFIPKFEILTFKEYISSISWIPYIVIATMVMVGKTLGTNGVTDWLVNLVFPKALEAGPFSMLLIVGLIIFALMIIVPSAPAIVSILAAPLVALASATGVNPVLFLVPLGLLGAQTIIFPFDSVPSITYATGYYTMIDLPKISGPVQVYLALVTAAWMPLALKLLGVL